jgi:formylglycine-generating enzyme required for sulfatase activity
MNCKKKGFFKMTVRTTLSGLLPVLFLFVLILPVSAAETGFIQIKCDPGVQIFLDGNFKGITSSDVGGLIIQNVSTGRHEIKSLKSGYQVQIDFLSVAADQVVTYSVKPFVPKIQISQKSAEHLTEMKLKVGKLLIQSLPIECKLDIAALGVKDQSKNKDRWEAKGVPVGKYKISARAMNRTMNHEVEIFENSTVEVFFNFVSEEIKDLGAERREKELMTMMKREKQMEVIREKARKQGLEFPPGWSFVSIEPGFFMMGSPNNRGDDEEQHKVTLTSGFWMGTYEVTQKQYEELMGQNPSCFKGAQRPVDRVSWDDVKAFLRVLNERERKEGRLPLNWTYSLPSEAQWEYACRAGSTTTYCFDNGFGQIDDFAWYNGNSENKTHPVGEKRPNAWGLYDMHGNVWEWCEDWYASYAKSPSKNPTGPASASSRVLRGGGWNFFARGCRSANRDSCTAWGTNNYLGFRVCLQPHGKD